MPSATLIFNARRDNSTSVESPLPQFIQTPSGLALLEIQGKLNLPAHNDGYNGKHEIGTLNMSDKTAWLWIGNHQRMEGKIVELTPPLGILKRADNYKDTNNLGGNPDGSAVEFVDVIRHKIVFNTRPEPMVLGRF